MRAGPYPLFPEGNDGLVPLRLRRERHFHQQIIELRLPCVATCSAKLFVLLLPLLQLNLPFLNATGVVFMSCQERTNGHVHLQSFHTHHCAKAPPGCISSVVDFMWQTQGLRLHVLRGAP